MHVCVCVFWVVPEHNRQSVTQSDRAHDPSQQEAQTVAPHPLQLVCSGFVGVSDNFICTRMDSLII